MSDAPMMEFLESTIILVLFAAVFAGVAHRCWLLRKREQRRRRQEQSALELSFRRAAKAHRCPDLPDMQ